MFKKIYLIYLKKKIYNLINGITKINDEELG